MPNRDKTGPEGKGSKTGRGMGQCSPEEQKKIDKEIDGIIDGVLKTGRGQGRGLGRGRGRGFGVRRGRWADRD